MFLDPQMEIRGTMDIEILAKEKASVHSGHLFVDNLQHEILNGLKNDTVYRLYKINRLMTSVQMDSPIPYLFKGFLKKRNTQD